MRQEEPTDKLSEEQVQELLKKQKEELNEEQIQELLKKQVKPSTELKNIGKYTVIEKLGHGAMGTVYKAFQKDLGRIVAIKVMKELDDETMASRFQREALAMAHMRHPNIVDIYDTGEVDGKPYIVMKFVEGTTLSKIIESPERPPLVKLLEYFVQICDAIEHAHQRGVIHRDIKPSNVMIDKLDNVFITDFGLARPVERRTGLTLTGDILGTPQFMSPEQASGKVSEIDHRTDIYSLGALLYNIITGIPPFTGFSAWDIIKKVCYLDPIPPRKINPKISVDLQTICLKALEKEPKRRYQSVRELKEDVQRLLNAEPISARPSSVIYRAKKYISRHKIPFAIGTVSVVVILFLIGYLVASEIHRQKALLLQRKLEIERQAEELFNTASAFFENKEYQKARELLVEIVSRFKDSGSYIKALWKLTQLEEVEKERPTFSSIYWLKKIEKPEAYIKMAEIYEYYGQLNEARECYRKALLMGGLSVEEQSEIKMGIEFCEFFAKSTKIGDEPVKWFDIGDVDGDGEEEIVAVVGEHLLIYKSNGMKFYLETKIPIPLEIEKVSRLEIGDFNNDGQPEILLSNAFPEFQEGGCYLSKLKNNKLEILNFIPLPGTYISALAITDLENDGIKEVVVGLGVYQGRAAYIWQFIGSKLTKNIKIFPQEGQAGSDIQAVLCDDLDKDGSLEIVISAARWNHYQILVYSIEKGVLVLKARKLVGSVARLLHLGDGYILCLKTDNAAPNRKIFGMDNPLLLEDGVFILKYENGKLKRVWEEQIVRHEEYSNVGGKFELGGLRFFSFPGSKDKFFLLIKNSLIKNSDQGSELIIYKINNNSQASRYKSIRISKNRVADAKVFANTIVIADVYGLSGLFELYAFGIGQVKPVAVDLDKIQEKTIADVLFENGYLKEAKSMYLRYLATPHISEIERGRILLKVAKIYELEKDIDSCINLLKDIAQNYKDVSQEASKELLRICEENSLWEQAIEIGRKLEIEEEKLALYSTLAGHKNVIRETFFDGVSQSWLIKNPLAVHYNHSNAAVEIASYDDEGCVMCLPLTWGGGSFFFELEFDSIIVEWACAATFGLVSDDEQQWLLATIGCGGGGGANFLTGGIWVGVNGEDLLSPARFSKYIDDWQKKKRLVKKIKIEYIKPWKQARFYLYDRDGMVLFRDTLKVPFDFKPGAWKFFIGSKLFMNKLNDYLYSAELKSIVIYNADMRIEDKSSVLNKAHINFANGRYKEAAELYKGDSSEFGRFCFWLANFINYKDTEKAVKEIRRIVKNNKDILEMLRRSIRYERAIYKKLLELLLPEKEYQQLILEHASLVTYNQRYDVAIHYLKWLLERGYADRPMEFLWNRPVIYLLGECYYELGLMDEARAYFMDVVNRHKEITGAYIYLASICIREGGPEDAKEWIKKAILNGYDPIFIQARRDLSELISEDEIIEWTKAKQPF